MKRYLLHRFILSLLRNTAIPIVKRVHRYDCDKHEGPNVPSIIISNHNSSLDAGLVAAAFSRHMYFLASEHAVGEKSNAGLIKLIFDPIYIDKSKSDSQSVRQLLTRIKEGANVCLFPEGNRSFNGVTCNVPASTGKLIKISGADLITFRISGGYFTTPRWAKTMRKGKMHGSVVNVYKSEELSKMSASQINEHIKEDIHEDAYERQKSEGQRFKGKRLAESIEVVLYLCVKCKRFQTLKSVGDSFFCDCGFRAIYTDTGHLSGKDSLFSTITEWDRWQSEELKRIVEKSGNQVICSDNGQRLYVDKAISENLVGTGQMTISRDTFHCCGHVFGIDEISRFAVVGQMMLLFSLKNGESFEVQSDTPRSALKYMEIFEMLREERGERREERGERREERGKLRVVS